MNEQRDEAARGRAWESGFITGGGHHHGIPREDRQRAEREWQAYRDAERATLEQTRQADHDGTQERGKRPGHSSSQGL